MSKLCVNIDHIATVRQARREESPSPLEAALLALQGGAIGITVHLREDRRHIQDHDLKQLRKSLSRKHKLNLEMALTPAMLAIAAKTGPDEVTLVPENRRELTTEGGLEVMRHLGLVSKAVARLKKAGIVVSLFITPDPKQILAAAEADADYVELHTGAYAQAFRAGGAQGAKKELARLKEGVGLALELGLRVNLGHGLTYENVGALAAWKGVEDLNIGHSIVGRALMVGMERAVKEMIKAMKGKK